MLKKVKRIKLGKQVYRRLMKRVLERDRYQCRKCGSLENLQVHHRVRRSQQGHDALGNLVTLCAYCHMQEHGQLCYDAKAIQTAKIASERGKQGNKGAIRFEHAYAAFHGRREESVAFHRQVCYLDSARNRGATDEYPKWS